MNRQHAPIALAGVAATAALLLPFSGHAAGSGRELDPPPDPGTRQCFIEPPRWNEALDGPLPRCPVVTSARTTPDMEPGTANDHLRPGLSIL